MGHELVIALRVYPGISKSPAFFPNNKQKLVDLSFRSLVSALEGLDYHVHLLDDGCPDGFLGEVPDRFRSVTVHRYDGIGNYGTYREQLRLLSEETDANAVCLAEDDYLYRPGAFTRALSVLASSQRPDFVSLYDHPDYYRLPIHPLKTALVPHEGIHWRRSASTTLSFLTSPAILAETRSTLELFASGYHDSSVWMALTGRHWLDVRAVAGLYARRETRRYARYIVQSWKARIATQAIGRRRVLLTPIPALATHLERGDLSIGVNWDEVVRPFLE